MGEALDINSATQALKGLRGDNPLPIDEPGEPEETNFGEALETEIEESDESEQPIVQEVEGADNGAESYDIEADDLTSLLGIKSDQLDVDEEGKIYFKAKLGDEYSNVSLESLINAYQGDANLTNRSKKIAEQERTVQSKLSEYHQYVNNFTNQAAKILESVKEFVNPYNQEELKALRMEDPGEYAAKMEEIREREKHFNQIVNQAVELTSNANGTISEDAKAQYTQYLTYERQKVREAVPEWDKVEQDVVNYAKDEGWSNEEIGMIADARIQVALYKAMMHDKGKESVKKKLSKPIPKITRPGKAASKTSFSLDQVEKARKRLKESGSVQDAVNLFKLRRN